MVIFKNIIAIFRKELQGYFASPLAYIVAAIFWLLSGFFFIFLLLDSEGVIQQVTAREQLGIPAPPVDVASVFLSSFLELIGSLCLYILPILSMGLYAEERQKGTLELLATSPLTNWSVAVGKLLGVTTFFTFMILPLLVYEAITFSTANPPLSIQVPLLAHGGLILLAMAIFSLGMFISSLTNSSIIAAIITFTIVLFLWIIDVLATNLPGPLGEAIAHLSLLKHYDNMIQGIFDTSSLIIFVSYIILGVFLTAQSIEALRFQRS